MMSWHCANVSNTVRNALVHVKPFLGSESTSGLYGCSHGVLGKQGLYLSGDRVNTERPLLSLNREPTTYIAHPRLCRACDVPYVIAVNVS